MGLRTWSAESGTRLTFSWPRKAVAAIAYGETSPDDVSVAKARARVESAGWEVILEQKDEKIVAVRTIEHKHAFPHLAKQH